MTTPIAHRALYSTGTAALAVLLSGIALAVSQAHVIYDWLQAIHAWDSITLWAAAAGYELAILAVGLVITVTGDRRLWAGELLLVGVSVGIGVDVALRAQGATDGAAWLRAGIGGVMSLQYLCVVLAGHRLAGVGASSIVDHREAPASTVKPSTRQRAPRRAQAATNAGRAGILAAVADNPDASRRELARLAGTSDGTVRRMEREGAIRRNGGGWEVPG